MKDPEHKKKVTYGTVSPKGGTEGLTDKDRVHEGALQEAAERAEAPMDYPTEGRGEEEWARRQLNKGPSSDYVGHNRRVEDLPERDVVEAPADSVRRDRRTDTES